MLGFIYYNLRPDGINTGSSTGAQVKISGMLFIRPRVCLKSGAITGMDAVVYDGDAPSENENLNLELLEELFCVIGGFVSEGRAIIPVSVHIEGDNLEDDNFIADLINLKEKYSLPHGAIEIELKGDALKYAEDYDETYINRLRKSGFNFSIHNFGEGVSLIDLLRRYPIDLLKFKIDMFGHSLPMEKERAMLTHIVRMSQTMDIPVLCEGVASVQQDECAKLTESDIATGDYYGQPVPAAQFYNIYGKK